MAATVERELGKDCDCRTHSGPHWLHMDKLTHERNRELLQAAKEGNVRAGFAFVDAEYTRLKEKERSMQAIGLISYRETAEGVIVGKFDVTLEQTASIGAAIAQLIGA